MVVREALVVEIAGRIGEVLAGELEFLVVDLNLVYAEGEDPSADARVARNRD